MSDSLRPYGPWPARLLCPWDSSGMNTGLSCPPPKGSSSWPRDRTHVSCTGRQILYQQHPLEVRLSSSLLLPWCLAWYPVRTIVTFERYVERKGDEGSLCPHVGWDAALWLNAKDRRRMGALCEGWWICLGGLKCRLRGSVSETSLPRFGRYRAMGFTDTRLAHFVPDCTGLDANYFHAVSGMW